MLFIFGLTEFPVPCQGDRERGNHLNGRTYTGHTNNLYNRLDNYFSNSYLNRASNSGMAICKALLKYGVENFSLHVLEIVKDTNVDNLRQRENYWFNITKSSYNIAIILNPFVGENHPRFGKSVPQETRDKISNTLKGRVTSDIERQNHSLGARRKPIYCYDYFTLEKHPLFEEALKLALTR